MISRPMGDASERQRLLSSTQAGHGTIPAEPALATPTEPQAGRYEDISTGRLMLMLAGPFTGGFLAAVDSTLVGTLGGAMSSSLGDLSLLSWIGSSYFVATCVSQPVVGKISDVYGRRPVLLAANVVFCLGNVLCAASRSERALLAGRVVAGLGGGCLGPVSTFIMSDVVPLRRRGVWQGAGNVCWGVGSGIGGPLGGWIVQAFDWRWAFAFQVPITVLVLFLIMSGLPETASGATMNKRELTADMNGGRNGNDNGASNNSVETMATTTTTTTTHLDKLRRIDFLGLFTLAAFLIILLLALNTGGSLLPWSDIRVIACLCVSAVLLAAFIFVENSVATEPILELGLFGNGSLTAAWLANWFASMARFGLLFYGPLLFQAQGFSVAQTGLRFVPEAAATAVSSISAGAVMRATGTHYWLGVGAVAAQIVGLALVAGFTAVPLDASVVPPGTAFAFVAVAASGYSGMLTTTLVAMIAAAEQRWQAVVTSTSYAFRSTGSVIGITIASAVFQNALRSMVYSELKDHEDPGSILKGLRSDLHFLDRLQEPLRSEARRIYIAALRTSFFTLVFLACLALVAISLMREHKLHARMSRRD